MEGKNYFGKWTVVVLNLVSCRRVAEGDEWCCRLWRQASMGRPSGWKDEYVKRKLMIFCAQKFLNVRVKFKKWAWFLGAFAKLRKSTFNFVMSVRPSAWNNSAPTGRIFMKFHIWVLFENLSGKVKQGKAVPLQAWIGPEGSRRLRFPDFMTTAQDGGKVVSLTHRSPLSPGNTPGTHCC
jgi:hypothetical protein